MPDYQAMYLTLFKAVSETIYALQRSQQITEEMYVSSENARDEPSGEPVIKIFSPDGGKK